MIEPEFGASVGELFLEAISIAAKERARIWGWPKPCAANRWDVQKVLGGVPLEALVDEEVPGVPWKIVLAKAKRLINRKIIDGCPCGCRGDFEIIGD